MGIGTLKIKRKDEDFKPPEDDSPPKRIAIVDGDIVCYQSCPPRKRYLPSGKSFVELDENGERVFNEMTPRQTMDYITESWDNFYKTITGIGEKLFCDEVLVAVSGVRNFRNDLFYEYKEHRTRQKAPPNPAVPKMRERAVREELAIQAVGYEADDLVRIWAEEARRAGHEFIIVSYDKDLLCIPGEHYILHRDKPQEFRTVTDEEATRNYYEQLLQGDPTDNIPGIPGVGPKIAVKLLAGAQTEEEMQELVVEQYIKFFGDDWEHYLLLNGKLIHILRDRNDYFTAKGWKIVEELS